MKYLVFARHTVMRRLIVAVALIPLTLPVLAQQADPLAKLGRDWAALDGSISAADRAKEHVADAIKALIVDTQKVAKDADAARQDAKASDARLKWVLDNWVAK